MFDQSFSFILTIAALVVGFMLFTGHGSIFMKGGNTQARNQKYDEKKMTKGSGGTLILFGIVTFIDSYTTSLTAKIIYILAILAILVGFVVYLKKKCIKK